MKKQISTLLACFMLFSCLTGIAAEKVAANQSSIVTYDSSSFSSSTDGWDTTALDNDSDFDVQNYVQLSPGAAMWQGIPITTEGTSPHVGDKLHAEVTFITHSDITNMNNTLIRVVGNNQHLVEISSIDDAITGEITSLQANPKQNDGVIPVGTDTLWVELHNDTDGTLEIQSIKLWGERSSETFIYAIPNANFTEAFAGNWDSSGTINVSSSIYMQSGVTAWRSLPLSSDNLAPLQGDVVEAQISLFISDSVTTNDHVYLRLNDGTHTLIDVNNMTDLPRNQWATVNGQVINNGAIISDSASELWINLYNDSNAPIRIKNIQLKGTRINTTVYDLNEDSTIDELDLTMLQEAYENADYDIKFDYDSDAELTNKDIIYFRKYGLQESNLFYLNLDHFLFMNEEVEIESTPMLITHLYSEPIDRNNLSKGYEWVGDPQEGFAAVDDVARSVTAFAEHYRLYDDTISYENIKLGLAFLMWMQHTDGDYDNFVVRNDDGTIEKKDSYSSNKSFTWWALRAYEAMAEAYDVIKDSDSELKETLETRLALNLQRLTQLTDAQYGETFTIDDRSYAKWMLGGDAWLTSGAINSLYAHHQIADKQTQHKIEAVAQQLGEALAMTQTGTFDEFPYGGFMHIIENTEKQINWDEWGSIAIRAMAYAGALTDNQQWIDSAIYAADSFISDLMISGRAEKISPNKKPYPLINYGTASHVDNLLALYEITDNSKYAKLAGIVGSWWTGNNVMNIPMFNQEKGYAYDGMTATDVNINSGGESLAEAIRTLSRLLSLPEAEQYLYASTTDTFGAQVIEIEHLFERSAPPDSQKLLPNGMLNSSNDALVIQQPQSGTNEQLIYEDAQVITTSTEIYPSWYGKNAIFVAADGYNNMRLFDEGELSTTLTIGQADGQFQAGDYVKLDFAARVEFDTNLVAEVFAVNNEQEKTLVASSENMSYHARTWYAGVNSVKTTPIAPIPDDATTLVINFNVNSTKPQQHEGYAMVTEAKIYTMGVTEIRFGNTELSNSSYIELYPNDIRTFTIEAPKDATYDILLSYVHQNEANFDITFDEESLDTVALSEGENGKVSVTKVGRLNLTAGEHQLTLSNLSDSVSTYLDAITLYPITSYVSYTLASNELYSAVRDVEDESFLWVEGTPTITMLEETPAPPPSSPPSENTSTIVVPSDPSYWTLDNQVVSNQNGSAIVSIPNNRSNLILTAEDLQSFATLQLVSSLYNIYFNASQIEEHLNQLNANTRLVVSVEQLSPISGLTTTFPIIDVQLTTIDNNGNTINILPTAATLSFNGITDDTGLGLYTIADDGTTQFYGIGQLQQNQWLVRIEHSNRYIVMSHQKMYDDLPKEHWANQAVSALSSWHIIKGKNDLLYGLQDEVTQAELLTLLVRIHNLNTRSTVVDNDSLVWYQPYLNQANNLPFFDKNGFSANQMMTRQQVASWIDDFITQNNLSVVASNVDLEQYGDVNMLSPADVSTWSTLISLGIIQGNQNKMLNPNQIITRAEISIILYRLMMLMPK